MPTLPAALATPIRRPLLELLRPRQWVKNAFVLAPLIFSGSFLDGEAVARALAAFALFCVAASATYVLNDLHDLERDRLHPTKRFRRPLAAGLVTPTQARALLAALCAVLLLGLAGFPQVVGAILAYLVLNVAYTLRLKAIPLVDLFCVAAGFVLRVWAGALALPVPVTPWTLITTLCLALYLAAIKRRQELAANGAEGRGVLAHYTVPLLDRYAQTSAVGAVIFYGLFVAMVRPELAFTIPFVLFGLFRYWFIVERLGGGESPTDALWTDVPLAATVLGWVALSMYALWPS